MWDMSRLDESPHFASPLPPKDPSRAPRILVAEDDAVVRGLVADGLRDDGYEIIEDADGGRLLVDIAAIYAVEGKIDPVDLIVSDIRMPVCTGLDIVKGIREAHWPIPVILMTAFADQSVELMAAQLGAFLLLKPFAMLDLRLKVKELLSSPIKAG